MARIAGWFGGAAEQDEWKATVRGMLSGGDKNVLVLDAPGVALGYIGSDGGAAASNGHLAVIDGRVLNGTELREQLGRPSATDAAVVLELCRSVGLPKAMQQIEGEICVAFWDAEVKALFIARDRIGVKPLYYAATEEGGAGFSSIPAPLLRLPGVSSSVDPRFVGLFAGSHYRTFDTAPERSPFLDVAQLPAAHAARFGRDDPPAAAPYWKLGPVKLPSQNEDELAEHYRQLLTSAVGKRLAVTEKPAFTLSGGMDSSSVAASAARISGEPVDAFSSVYTDPTFDERDEIQDMVDAGLVRWNPIELTDEMDVMGLVEHLVRVHNEPVATATWLSHHLVAAAVAGAGHDALFGGLGGDELNAGEYEYFPFFFADLKENGRDDQLAEEIERWAEYHDHPIFRKDAKIADSLMASLTVPGPERICRPNLERQQRYFPAVQPDYFDLASFTPVMEHPFPSFLNNRAFQDLTRETTPCCLRAEDRQSAAHGLQHYDPFLDHTLVEFMFSVPPELKVRDGVTKYLLRKAMKGILPEATRGRIKKTGWNAPAHKWFSGEGLDVVRDLVASRQFRERGIYDVAEVERLLDQHERIVQSGDATSENHMMFLWQLVNLELWLRWVDEGAPID